MEIHLLDKQSQRLMQSSVQIQSPVTVIKELLDNAIDAKATQISVSIAKNGMDSISVTDNGTGISSDGLRIIGKNRATSKEINSETSGFRGEALYVIASISSTDIVSKTAD